MSGTGPSSGFWGGACWGLLGCGFIFAIAGELVAASIAFGSATIAAAIREQAA